MALKIAKKETTPTVDLSYFHRQRRSIDEILVWCSENNCSDLWIKRGEVPYISIFGKIIKLPCYEISREQWRVWYETYVLKELNALYVRSKTLDLSIQVRMPENSKYFGKTDSNYFRYRCALSYSEEQQTATFRMIKPYQITFDKINFPTSSKNALEEACKVKAKLILICGATGSGKALHNDTVIPTSFGKTTMKELKKGDIIYDGFGKPTEVLDKYSPESKLFYELTFNDGTKIKSADNHLWEVLLLKDRHKKPKHKPFIYPKLRATLKNLLESEDIVSIKEFNKEYLNKKTRKIIKPLLTPFIINNSDEQIINMSDLKGKIDGKVDYITQLLQQNFNRSIISINEFKRWYTFLDIKKINKKYKLGLNLNEDLIQVKDIAKTLLEYNDDLVQQWKVVGKPKEVILDTNELYQRLKKQPNSVAITIKHSINHKKLELDQEPYLLGSKVGREEIKEIDSNLFITSRNEIMKFINGLLDNKEMKVRKNKIEIAFKSRKLLQQVQSLISLLGWKNERKQKTLSFIPETNLHLRNVKLSNRINQYIVKLDNKHHIITNIKRIEGNSNEYHCISVKSDCKTFLCSDNYIKTHNSTTLAATINTFKETTLNNQTLITLEDPIENRFTNTDSFNVMQKELNVDFKGFPEGVKTALREHPNIVLVGECRDKEVITSVLEATKTGHTVFSTFHAGSVSGTISRMLYHLDNDINLGYDLITNLSLVMAQRIIPSDNKYIVDTQYMIFNEEITKAIVDIIFSEKETNVALEVERLMQNKKYQELGYIKDWDYN